MTMTPMPVMSPYVEQVLAALAAGATITRHPAGRGARLSQPYLCRPGSEPQILHPRVLQQLSPLLVEQTAPGEAAALRRWHLSPTGQRVAMVKGLAPKP